MIRFLKIIIEIIGWLAITGGVTVATALLSYIAYIKSENKSLSLAILLVGIIIGAIWATRISIKYGTMEWLSGIRRIT